MGGDNFYNFTEQYNGISIHAPRVGGDSIYSLNNPVVPLFQSTPPVWGATDYLNKTIEQTNISIHAPRVGGDH